MTASSVAYVGAAIFDGHQRHNDHALIVSGGRIEALVPVSGLPSDVTREDLEGGLLCPGFVDLQVNGGGGIMFNDDESVATLRTMAEAHARLGATSILPTLITDTPDHTRRAIAAVEQAVAEGVDGIIGLHLEGPHLSIARKGAHDPSLIRAMASDDLALLIEAASRLPMLKMTVAPENVTPEQIAALHGAGVLVSLGHSDASFEACQSAAKAGAICVTHLFNAMSQLGNREPGLVGTALSLGDLSAGLIADGIHVHPATVRTALAAKQGPGRIFLVSDAMALAGSDNDSFTLNGRLVQRCSGRLTLDDGTLAGADLDLLQAVHNIFAWGGVSEDEALAMATSCPGALCPQELNIGVLAAGAKADFVHLLPGQARCAQVWQSGNALL